VKHTVNAAEVFLCFGTRALNMFGHSHIKLNNFGWGIELASGSLGDGKTSACTSQENCGTFALSQLGDPEG
jgi:hypothetical protein